MTIKGTPWVSIILKQGLLELQLGALVAAALRIDETLPKKQSWRDSFSAVI